MHNLLKVVILILLFSQAPALAETCAPQNNDCKIAQSQLKMLQESGIKPTEILEAPTTAASESKKEKSTFTIQPFKVPPPGFAKPTEPADFSEKNKDATTELQPKTKPVPTTNIYGPTPQQEPEFVFQPPQSPSVPPALLPKGIQYQ